MIKQGPSSVGGGDVGSSGGEVGGGISVGFTAGGDVASAGASVGVSVFLQPESTRAAVKRIRTIVYKVFLLLFSSPHFVNS